MLSPALNTERSAVFFTEFGVMVLTSWILNLKLPLLTSPIAGHQVWCQHVKSIHLDTYEGTINYGMSGIS